MRINKTTLKNKRVIVAYEVARKLYEMGFNEPCIQYYATTSQMLFGNEWSKETTKDVPNDNISKGIYGVYSAPTVSQAYEWLLNRAISFKNKAKGLYGFILKGEVSTEKMADFLFEVSKQFSSVGPERITKAVGQNLVEIARLLFPNVTLESKYPGFVEAMSWEGN